MASKPGTAPIPVEMDEAAYFELVRNNPATILHAFIDAAALLQAEIADTDSFDLKGLARRATRLSRLADLRCDLVALLTGREDPEGEAALLEALAIAQRAEDASSPRSLRGPQT